MENNEKDGVQRPVNATARGRGIKTAVNIAEVAMFAALMVAGAYIQIPFPFVPLTFQTAVAVLAGLLLGTAKGSAAMAVYAFMGLIGLPVFTSGGGFSYVLRPSFGYILGFIAAAAAEGLIVGRSSPCRLIRLIFAALAAFAVNYAVGVAYFIAVWQLSGYEGLRLAVVDYNLIYMPKDVILSVLAAVVAWRVLPVIRKLPSRRR